MSELHACSPASLLSVCERISEFPGQILDDASQMLASLRSHKVAAVAEDDQALAKEIWCLETVIHARSSFESAFVALKAERYYEAWCKLYEAETFLKALRPHHSLHGYGLEWIAEYVSRFQSMFPYRKFASIGFLILEKRCGLCDAILKPSTACRHRKGEIYNGEMCFHVLTDVEPNHVALVDDPHDKRCIIELNYDFSLVQYLAEHLESPYDRWNYEMTKVVHPHSFFSSRAKTDPCPCSSGDAYGDCCATHPDGVLMPHINFIFAAPPKKPMILTLASACISKLAC